MKSASQSRSIRIDAKTIASCGSIFALTGLAAGAPPTSPVEPTGAACLTIPAQEWKLVWHDDFEGFTLDPTKWSIGLPWNGDDGTNRHHNSQYASSIADADVSVRDGALHLTTRRAETPNPRGGAYHFTEGLITTSGKFEQTFGYFEMRARLPVDAGPGTWPAFWLLTEGWPPEMDILEYWGSENRIHQGTVTRGPDGKQHWDSYHRKNVSMAGWHTFGLEWGPGYQIYNIDGVRTNSIFAAYLPTTPHYILLNSGIESARPPQAGTKFPNDFVVDWVRVYARPDVPAVIGGDFESDDPRPWQLEGEASVVDYGSHGGRRCLRLDGTSAVQASARQTIYSLKPSTRYTLQAFTKATGGKSVLSASQFGGVVGGPASNADMSNGDYKRVNLEFTTGPQATSAVIACSADIGATAFFDDVSLAVAKP